MENLMLLTDRIAPACFPQIMQTLSPLEYTVVYFSASAHRYLDLHNDTTGTQEWKSLRTSFQWLKALVVRTSWICGLAPCQTLYGAHTTLSLPTNIF